MRLATKIVEKPWGMDALPPRFNVPVGKRIGEVWFEPPPQMPDVLVKYIFTSEKLSVQVHPSNEQAAALGERESGKEECWLVIDAEPGATLGIGFTEEVDTETVRRAALDGTIEQMMQWHPVRPGDFFYIPAGTVHAIGAGVSLIEIQQNSDITYRLYDYGRPRELHLEKGLQVAKCEPYEPRLRARLPEGPCAELARGPNFVIYKTEGPLAGQEAGLPDKPWIVVPLAGQVSMGDESIAVGSAALASASDRLAFDANGACLVICAR